MDEPQTSALDSRIVDREHRVQLLLMQALTTAIEQGGDNVEELLAQLADFSRAHFLSEELLMRQYAYPDYDDHVLDHEKMVVWLEAIAAHTGDRAVMRNAVGELNAIIRKHIDSRDHMLQDFLGTLAVPSAG